MPGDNGLIAFYPSKPAVSVIDDALVACQEAGLEVPDDVEAGSGDDPVWTVVAKSTRLQVSIRFDLDDDRDPSVPVVSIGFGNALDPAAASRKAVYRDRMGTLFELMCRTATALSVEYAALFDPDESYPVPSGRPIGESLDELPLIGVYSADVLDALGGIDAVSEGDPWYSARLPGDETLVIDSESVWTDSGWAPPTGAPYLTDVNFGPVPEPPESVDLRALADPFSALDAGEYGVDVCVAPEDYEGQPDNDALRAVRVRVGDDGALRRADSDAVVRRVVDADRDRDAESQPDPDFAELMVGDASDEPVVSVLCDGTVPPAFVRLDGPNAENVVSKVLALDTGVDKVELLGSLGRTAREQAFTADDVDEMESSLDTLLEVDDVDDFDQMLRSRFL